MPIFKAAIKLFSAPILLGLAASPVVALAQAKPQFDVASVKVLKVPAAPHGVALLINHGTLRMEAAELRQIIGLAFGIQRVLVRECPAWCDEDQFDIVAKTDNEDATRDQIKEMLQALLAERFNLQAHRESKEVAGYELVVAREKPKLEVAKEEAGTVNVFTPHAGGLGFHNMNLVGLVNYLANVLGQPVKDMTGLTGRYNFNLDLRPPDNGPLAGTPLPQPTDVVGVVLSSVEEQLGLKLRARRVPTDMLVIDSVQHPSEN